MPASGHTSNKKVLVAQMEYQLGQSAKAAALEGRRREALGEGGHADLIRLMLAKYRCAVLPHPPHTLRGVGPCTSKPRQHQG